MSNKHPESNIPERVTAPAEMLEPAIAELLRRIPETWEVYQPDSLTEVQAQALFLLMAAGMVERRERLRLRMLNDKIMVEATITATGEYGAGEAIEPLAAEAWALWQEAYRQWRESDRKENSPFHSERLSPSEWRLTDQGVLAKNDLADGGQAAVLDFVLKRGLFDGQRHWLPGGRISQRMPVRGKGSLVKVTKIKEQPGAPDTVNIGNWDEGGEALAKAFSSLFEAMLSAQAGKAPPSGEKPKVKRRGRKEISPAEAAKRQGILDRWERSGEAGVARKDFCADENISTNYLEQCQEWKRQRDRKTS
jgi:hypothetical protein